MPKLKSVDRARAADEAAIARSTHFTVVRFVGRSGYEPHPPSHEQIWSRRDFVGVDPATVLAEARRVKAEIGTDEYGRRPMIYAVSPEGMSIFVE